ncbi:Macrolide export ATP-binding/permease protein MacB [Hartmannibacter diazotrophicus]|uniref:Macrolide export ATP-binding/permease protein MacB n=1 Tax=Hartmannibacter diazotrophicus TaxID=1482074 RepID=A0A2C9DCZ2_9HYPH|nr:ABC transporter ATP-binding protein [Hartmannibacter diazotrophicus]SON57485.1 Macrolide export ATP-binding/permease protein MacB [Hartmannibacter diazotrophicus]
MMNDAVLSVRGARKHYRSGETVVRALDGVSIDIRAGELVGIIGPSGSGKSTFLMIAGLLEPPTAGTVTLAGESVSDSGADLNRLRDFRRRHIGFIFQKANLIPFLTAEENVALALTIDDVPIGPARAYARELLAALDLVHRADNIPARLSGGEQQRVAVARALANDPPLLLADEPTAALDSVRGRQVMELFRKIATERGSAVAVVTHDPRSLDLFDRIIEFEDGKVRQGANSTLAS